MKNNEAQLYLAHEEVLSSIRSEGALKGIDFYKRYKELYESAPLDTAIPLWKEIFQAIQEKERASPVAVLMKDDPYLDIPLEELTDETVREMVAYRENPPLDASIAEYILNVYANAIRMTRYTKWVPVCLHGNEAQFGIAEGPSSERHKDLYILN